MKPLKITLWICGIAFLFSAVFAFLPWGVTLNWVRAAGVPSPPTNPMAILVFRFCLVLIGLIGVFFVMLARNPLGYGGMLLLGGYGLVGLGLFILMLGSRYELPAWTYTVDGLFCSIAGVSVLVFRRRLTTGKQS